MAAIPLPLVDAQMQRIDDAIGHARKCDGCTVCCHVVGVRELNKPYFQDCKHQCKEGCAIYAQRPRSCHEYICGWRGGIIDGERPDKQGFVVNLNLVGIFEVWEAWKGACDTEENKAAITKIAQQNGDVLFSRYGQHGVLRWWLSGEYEQGKEGKAWRMRHVPPSALRAGMKRISLAMAG